MPFTTHRRVEFRDTDAAGIVHFSAFFPMMEAAEHELLRSLGIAILPRGHDGHSSLTWPRVAASCDYKSAARFEDTLQIDVDVVKIGSSSIQYRFTITQASTEVDGRGDPPRCVAVGHLTAVACRLSAAGDLEKAPIPDAIRIQLAQYATPLG